MSGSAEDRKKMKYAEWHCDYCGTKVLLKFAVGNTISVTTLNDVPIQVTLKYGQMELQAQCPKCKETSERPIDWGWLA
jgi:DNA-directed RNA polymerase subunit RPC12/RpoP